MNNTIAQNIRQEAMSWLSKKGLMCLTSVADKLYYTSEELNEDLREHCPTLMEHVTQRHIIPTLRVYAWEIEMDFKQCRFTHKTQGKQVQGFAFFPILINKDLSK